ncbi:MAG: hypothetical protein EON88_15730 [Brevundimonas sp.]|nr:MAG: hypothetical protein EON88_15730 [Brevundimonas sp.]
MPWRRRPRRPGRRPCRPMPSCRRCSRCSCRRTVRTSPPSAATPRVRAWSPRPRRAISWPRSISATATPAA